MLDIEAISRSLGLALMSDGTTVEVDVWLNEDGPCDPEDATSAVVRPAADGKWRSVSLADFDAVTVN